MTVTLRLFATFREAVGQKTVEREFPEGATVETVLRTLESEYDDLAGQFIEDGQIRPEINVLRDGQEVRHLDGLDTPVSDGDTVSIFPPVAGG